MNESQPAADVNRVIRFGDLEFLQDVVGWFIFLCFLAFSYLLCSVFLFTPLLLLTYSSSAFQGQYLTSSPSHTHCILTSVFLGGFLGLARSLTCQARPHLPSLPALIWTLPAHFACWVFSLLLSHLKRDFFGVCTRCNSSWWATRQGHQI